MSEKIECRVETGGEHALDGQVKWFDAGKGFGFVVADNGGPDILLHANVLRGFGQGSISEGTSIRVAVQETPRGLQATRVIEIRSEDTLPFTEFEELAEMDPAAIAEIELEPARIKWFDKQKGFGFANIFGLSEDVFLHIEVLRRSGFAELQPGEALCLRTIKGPRGLMAVQAAPWEAVLPAPAF